MWEKGIFIQLSNESCLDSKTDQLKPSSCAGIVWALVRMPQLCQAPVAGLDSDLVGRLGDAKDFVIIVCDLAGRHIETPWGLFPRS